MVGRLPSPADRSRYAWLALSAAFGLGALIESLAEHRGATGALVALAMGGLMAVSWWRPVEAMAATVAVAGVQAALGNPLYQLSVAIYTLPAMMIMVGLRSSARGLALGVALGLGVFAAVLIPASDASITDVLFSAGLFLGLPALVGRTFRSRSQLNAELRERARRLAADREQRARDAAAAERRRIAGELHDLVAHGVSGMVVQAGAARRLVASGDPRATEAIRAVEDGGREALDELRRLLGVLRHDDADLALAPQPSLARVSSLVAAMRRRGIDVELRVDGDPPPMSPGVDVAAYRLIEEALQEATGATTVTVRYAPHAVDLVVEGAAPPADRLVGLRERVALFGGELVTARRGGALRAHLPLFGGPA